jgi:HSP20 family protein
MDTKKAGGCRDLLEASFVVAPACQRPDADADWFPAVDICEAGKEYFLEVDLPGLKPQEMRVSTDGDVLSISGERPPLHNDCKSLRVERPSGAFVRRLALPKDAVGGEIHATFHDGVLQLRMPRRHPDVEAGQPRPIALESK